MRTSIALVGLLVAVALLAIQPMPGTSAIVGGGSFTTFDAVQGGCNDSPNGVDCNNYDDKDDVYMSGGPNAAGLSDGTYFFAVLAPGFQNGGFVDGADGNLSDTTASNGGPGGGDPVGNRTFVVTNHEISAYFGTHGTGTSSNGRFIIQLSPYDDTPNPGGVYILAVCQTGATSPSQCKYDAFRIQEGGGTHFGAVDGLKYYDANVNGQWDVGEPGLPNWPIDFSDVVSGTLLTDASGNFNVSLLADTYTFSERQANSPWIQTGNTVDQSSVAGGASVTLNPDKSYTVVVVDNSTVSGLNFGNVCLGAGGGHTLGFWSNKNGQATMNDGATLAPELALLSGLHLRNANGTDFDPTTYAQFRTWLLNGTATNMAYMLSAQLAAMALNVEAGFVSGSSLVWDGTSFVTINALISAADAALAADGYTPAGDPNRVAQEALKDTLDAANNNQNFLQPTPATCPPPVFP